MTNKAAMWWVIGIVVVVLVAAGVWYFWYQPSATQNGVYNPAPTNNQAVENTGGQAAGGTAAKLSYSDAVKKYADRRIQFNQDCLPTPYYVTFKSGTTIMLDNRASVSKVISLDNSRYTVKAYDYVLVTLSTTAKLPHSISVDCGNGENNATIYLQQ